MCTYSYVPLNRAIQECATHYMWAAAASQGLHRYCEPQASYTRASLDSLDCSASLLSVPENAKVNDLIMASTTSKLETSNTSATLMRSLTPSPCVIRPWWIFCKTCRRSSFSMVLCLDATFLGSPAGLPSSSNSLSLTGHAVPVQDLDMG